MSSDRPDLNEDKAASDTDLEAAPDVGALDDAVPDSEVPDNDDQQSEPGGRPTGQDVTDGEQGQPIEPPD